MLTRTELRSWLEVIEGTRALLNALDRQLRTEAGMSHDDYEILSRLYREPGHVMRMADLASRVGYSPSRLTHAAARLERQGLVRRSRSAVDRRGIETVLTDLGVDRVRDASVGHFDQVRHIVFDTLGPDRVRQLGAAMSDIRRAAQSQARHC